MEECGLESGPGRKEKETERKKERKKERKRREKEMERSRFVVDDVERRDELEAQKLILDSTAAPRIGAGCKEKVDQRSKPLVGLYMYMASFL